MTLKQLTEMAKTAIEQLAPMCAFPGCGMSKDGIRHHCPYGGKCGAKLESEGAECITCHAFVVPAPLAPDSPPPGYRVCMAGHACGKTTWTRAPFGCAACCGAPLEYSLQWGGPDILRPPVAAKPAEAEAVAVEPPPVIRECIRNGCRRPAMVGAFCSPHSSAEQGPSAVASAPAVVRRPYVPSVDEFDLLPDVDVRR